MKHFVRILAVTAMASTWAMAADAKDALYKSLGGKKAIVAVVDEFVAADNRINSFFKATASDPKRLAAWADEERHRREIVPARTKPDGDSGGLWPGRKKEANCL